MISVLVTINLLLPLIWLAVGRIQIHLRVRLEILVLLTVIMSLGTYSIVYRFESGLGASTNLSNEFPWGIWIAFDLCGVALAAGGFVLAAIVHIFKIRRFEPILRPVILNSFISYGLVAAILVLDLGRPYRFWHPLVMWQPHSVMFEITMCISLYTCVLMLEFSPVIFEKLGWHRLATMIHDSVIPIVIVGVILSTLHQSSFGSLFLIVPEKLSMIWYTPILPLLFLISAIAVGIAVVIAESYLCAYLLNKHLSWKLLHELGRICSMVLFVFLAVRIGDLLFRAPRESFRGEWRLTVSFASEIVFGILIPSVWFWIEKKDRPTSGPFYASIMVIFGILLNRLNVCWFGILPFTGPVYFPSWMEIFSTAALVLGGIILFVVLSRFLPVFSEEEEKQ